MEIQPRRSARTQPLGTAFFDTNVFLYADAESNLAKQRKGIQLIAAHQSEQLAVVSLQVLDEYFAITTRKLGVAADLAQQKVENMSRLRVVRLSETDIISAIELHRLHKVSCWDAMIVHAARISGAQTLCSEDLKAGREWGGFRVVNPFAAVG